MMVIARMPGRHNGGEHVDTLRHPYMAEAAAIEQAKRESVEARDELALGILACAIVAVVAIFAGLVLLILGDHP